MPEEISAAERARRRAIAERIGTAPGAPAEHTGPSRRPYTGSLRIANAKGRLTNERRLAETDQRLSLGAKLGLIPEETVERAGQANRPYTGSFRQGPVRWR